MLYTSEQILQMVRSALVELFQLDPARVTLETRLADDLGIDSIDAVDLLYRVERATGRKIGAEDFRGVRTVGDLVNALARLPQAKD
jgi:acyl carrier protein